MKWSLAKNPYPLIEDVARALNLGESLTIEEYKYSASPSDICYFFGHEYIKEVKRLVPGLALDKELSFSFNQDKYLINPFLSDLEKYLSKCDIERSYKEEKLNDLELLASLALDPRDFYLRKLPLNGRMESWNLDHKRFVEMVKAHRASGPHWSLRSWRPSFPFLYYGDSAVGSYYRLDKILDNKKDFPDHKDLDSLLEEFPKYTV